MSRRSTTRRPDDRRPFENRDKFENRVLIKNELLVCPKMNVQNDNTF